MHPGPLVTTDYVLTLYKRRASDRFCPWNVYTARDHRAAVAGSDEFAVVPHMRQLEECYQQV